MMEAESLAFRALQPVPILARGLKQRAGADDIGLDEFRRAVDRTVDMGLGGQMHHPSRPVLGKNARERRGVEDIRLLEDMARVFARRAQGFQIAGIGQLVEIDDSLAGFGDILADHGRSYESGTAGDENCHVIFQCLAVNGGSIQGWGVRSRDSGGMETQSGWNR